MLWGTKTQPESNPLARGSQGLARLDCVTEWLPGLKGHHQSRDIGGFWSIYYAQSSELEGHDGAVGGVNVVGGEDKRAARRVGSGSDFDDLDLEWV